MPIEGQISEYLHQKAETMECPPAVSKRIEQSYSQYVQQKRSKKTMKKRLIGSIVAAVIMIPTAALAAPPLIEMITRTPMTAKQVKMDAVGQAALEKLYHSYPETKSFEIIDASRLGGDPANASQGKAIQTSIVLQEKGAHGKKIRLDLDATGKIEHVNQENWEPQEKPVISLTDQEIKSKVDDLINKLYGSSSKYEFSMEPMQRPDQKTLILNYTEKGSTTPFYQASVQGNTISVSLIGGGPAPSVEGFFTTNGKPDYYADNFLNDEKLFALLDMSPEDLKQELAKGASVVEIAASKKISKQQVVDIIATTQAKKQIQDDPNGGAAVDDHTLEQLKQAVEPKVLQMIEHKTETPW
ncbi:hypothetical protein JI735_19970 [Paenibacillus sonchi]|uniref:DUF4179 domain-containing protein n=2 Tax=Paenibacillus sonchi TaxID=373687 RepID=A0A974P904_9BACL|nr:hypothetical protein [Paenibacillus sonchi]QQZ59003.1 hypothetical protein JI735_19970 [Paenibacillus sonchi]